MVDTRLLTRVCRSTQTPLFVCARDSPSICAGHTTIHACHPNQPVCPPLLFSAKPDFAWRPADVYLWNRNILRPLKNSLFVLSYQTRTTILMIEKTQLKMLCIKETKTGELYIKNSRFFDRCITFA